eukprot:g1340.t1
MRLVIQRVLNGAVHVREDCVGKIGKGIVALVGIEERDTVDDVNYLAKKLVTLKLWPNDKGQPWKNDVTTNGYGILIVSQFTLHGYLKGTRPCFNRSMEPKAAKDMFDSFVNACKAQHDNVEIGAFGKMMEVSLINDGPITILLDSQEIGFKRRVKVVEKKKSSQKKAQGKKSVETVRGGSEGIGGDARKLSKKERKRLARAKSKEHPEIKEKRKSILGRVRAEKIALKVKLDAGEDGSAHESAIANLENELRALFSSSQRKKGKQEDDESAKTMPSKTSQLEGLALGVA